MATMTNCPYCGKLTDPKLDNCVHCGGFLRKGAAQPGARVQRPSQTCPSCGALVREGDIICVACGTNLLTGQKIAHEKQVAAARSLRVPSGIYIVLGVAAAVVLIGAIGLAVYLSRDPVARASALVRENRLTEATSILNDVIANKPDNARAHMELGRIHWMNSSYTESAEAFRRAHRADPENEEAGILSVLSLAERLDATSRDAQVDALQRLVDQDPENADYWYLLAQARGAKQDINGQIAALERALALRPNDVDANLALGVAKAVADELAAAEGELSRVVIAAENNPDAHAAYGLLNALQGETGEAIEHLETAVNAQTTITPEVLTELGILLFGEGKFPEAEAYLARAKDVPGASPAAAYFYAQCLKEQGDGHRVLSDFEAIAAGDGPFAALAAMSAADIHLADGDADAASVVMEKYGKRLTGTDEAERQTIWGRIQTTLGDFETARESFRNAKQTDSNYAPVYLESGLLFIAQQNMAEGIREIRRYLQMAPESDEANSIREFVDQLEQTLQAGGAGVADDPPSIAEPEPAALSEARRIE